MGRWITRILLYVFGLFCVALAVAFTVNSGLGVTAVNSLPYAVSAVTGFGFGNCVVVVFCAFILVQVALLRRQFKPINLLQILFSTIFGYFVDFAQWLCAPLQPTLYITRLLLLGASILLVAFGLMLYLAADIIPMPMEGMTLAIYAKQKRFTFPTVKVIVDCANVLLAVLVLLLFTGTVTGIREGTVLAALLVGKVLAVLNRFLAPGLRRVCCLPAVA